MYMVDTFKNNKAAIDFLCDIKETVNKLAYMATSFALCKDKKLQRLGYCKYILGHFILLYRINEENHTVIIQRVFHSLQDYVNLV